MTATEELRRLLDERGVKWTSERVSDGVLFTFAKDSRTYSVFARDRAGLEIWSKYLTPEQAIAAMLGQGMCHNTSGNELYFVCSECGDNPLVIRPHYCPTCGRKVVDPTTNDVDKAVDE